MREFWEALLTWFLITFILTMIGGTLTLGVVVLIGGDMGSFGRILGGVELITFSVALVIGLVRLMSGGGSTS